MCEDGVSLAGISGKGKYKKEEGESLFIQGMCPVNIFSPGQLC
jgi:hypothetical protein